MAKILVVDDSATARTMLEKLLRDRGHQCFKARDGEEGYTVTKLQHPDLVLLDVVMGAHDGFKACRRIKRDPETKDIPVVMVTCKTGESDEMWGRKMGADDFLRKPVSPEVLLETVQRYV
jgi:twitching motility two-component system response regulator PilH